MSDALLDVLREISRRQSAEASQNDTSPRSVESRYERNEKTHQLVERGDLDASVMPFGEERMPSDRIEKIAETLDLDSPAPRG
jgi:hypothetical protein